MAFLLAALVGIPAGLAAAAWKGRVGDRALTFGAVLAMSAPPFVVGSLLIFLLGCNSRSCRSTERATRVSIVSAT